MRPEAEAAGPPGTGYHVEKQETRGKPPGHPDEAIPGYHIKKQETHDFIKATLKMNFGK